MILSAVIWASVVGATLLVDQTLDSLAQGYIGHASLAYNVSTEGIVSGYDPHTQHLFVFGDSYSNVGFDWQGARPTPQNPIGNPAFPGANVCNCKIWVEYLTADYTVGRRTLTYDFANNCATVDAALARCTNIQARSLIDQVNEWREFRVRTSSDLANAWVSNQALYAFWFGANDAQLILDDMIDFKRTLILERYFQQIDFFHSQGVRNFLIMGLPALWRTPKVLQMSRPDQEAWTKSTNDFNWFLYQKVLDWRRSHGGARMAIADMKPLSEYVLNNPRSFGARDATCTREPGCLWPVDDFHPGTEVHRQFARCAVTKMSEQGLGEFFADPHPIKC